MTDPFLSRMAELDAIVGQCRGQGAFVSGAVRDASNRSNRDWPWWAIQIERMETENGRTCLVQAEIRLDGPAPGINPVFKASWLARIWNYVGPDIFRQTGDWLLDWDTPSPAQLDETMQVLLGRAGDAILEFTQASGR